jgi:hypothetical protein
MPETKQKSFAAELLKNSGRVSGMPDSDPDKDARRRHTSAGTGAQAFSLRADFKDGRKKRGTAWSHFSDYEWSDEGDKEKLVILFGTRVVTIEGFNLMVLVREIDEGRLKTFEELVSSEALRLQAAPDAGAVVVSVYVFPKFEDLVKEIKGETEEHETGHAGRIRR